MALLTLSGVEGSTTCYWMISRLQDVFNTDNYIRAGISSVEVVYGSEWEDISTDVLDYVDASSGGTNNYVNGSVSLPSAQSVYAFGQAANGLCYPAGDAEYWPGTWSTSGVTMVLTPSSKNILSEITGMSPYYGHTRNFKWYLDGVYKATSQSVAYATTHVYTVAPVYFDSTHTVRVEIYNEDLTILFKEMSDTASTLYAEIDFWSWAVSNGSATDVQTAAAYSTLANKELTSNFSRLVWNDLVDKVIACVTESGQTWKTTYGTAANTKIEEQYGSLMAAKFNAVVDNLRYPLWNWRDRSGIEGYLGRLAVLGVSTKGADADAVYARYLVEIAEKLNVMIGIYCNTGDIVHMTKIQAFSLEYDLLMHSRHSASMSKNQSFHLYYDMDASSLHSRPMTKHQYFSMTHDMTLIAERYVCMSDTTLLRMNYYVTNTEVPALHLVISGGHSLSGTVLVVKLNRDLMSSNIGITFMASAIAGMLYRAAMTSVECFNINQVSNMVLKEAKSMYGVKFTHLYYNAELNIKQMSFMTASIFSTALSFVSAMVKCSRDLMSMSASYEMSQASVMVSLQKIVVEAFASFSIEQVSSQASVQSLAFGSQTAGFVLGQHSVTSKLNSVALSYSLGIFEFGFASAANSIHSMLFASNENEFVFDAVSTLVAFLFASITASEEFQISSVSNFILLPSISMPGVSGISIALGVTAELDGGAPVAWDGPVQSGSNLSIYQVYDAGVSGSQLDLG